jgi:DNA-directed RNA polymerase subunit L
MSNIKVEELKKRPRKGLHSSKLVLKLSGSSINYAIVNTIRRCALDEVPCYAFCNKSIDIEANTSIFNNDMMRLRLSQLPIYNTSPDVINLDIEYWDVDYGNSERLVHPDDTKLIEIYIDIENNKDEVYSVTTNDCKYYLDSTEIECPYDKKYPILLVKLRRSEVFKCHMKGVLGLGIKNNIWSSVNTCFYEDLDNPENITKDTKHTDINETEVESHKFKLTIESNGQMDEYEILKRICNIVKYRLLKIKDNVKTKYDHIVKPSDNVVNVVLEDENHTIGHILNYTIQSNKKVLFAGYSKPDLLINSVVLSIAADEISPLEAFYKGIDDVISLFTTLDKQLK